MVSQMADEAGSTPIPPAMYRRIRAFTGGLVDFEDMIPVDPAERLEEGVPEPAYDRRQGDRRKTVRREEDRIVVSALAAAQAATLPDQRQLGRFTGGRRRPNAAAGRRAADQLALEQAGGAAQGAGEGV